MRVRDIKQWPASLRNTQSQPAVELNSPQKIVDIMNAVACAGQATRHLLPETMQYIELDHYGIPAGWYPTRSAITWPASTDSLRMLHLLEQHDCPGRALLAAKRLLHPGEPIHEAAAVLSILAMTRPHPDWLQRRPWLMITLLLWLLITRLHAQPKLVPHRDHRKPV